MVEYYVFYLGEDKHLPELVNVLFIDGVLHGLHIKLRDLSVDVYSHDVDDEVLNALLDIAEKLTRRAKKVTHRGYV